MNESIKESLDLQVIPLPRFNDIQSKRQSSELLQIDMETESAIREKEKQEMLLTVATEEPQYVNGHMKIRHFFRLFLTPINI